MLLAIITFSIDCASTATLPNASGSVDAEITKSDILYAKGINLHSSTNFT